MGFDIIFSIDLKGKPEEVEISGKNIYGEDKSIKVKNPGGNKFPKVPDTVPFVKIKPTESGGDMQGKWHIIIEDYVDDYDFSPGGAEIHEIKHRKKKLIIKLMGGTTDWMLIIVKPGARPKDGEKHQEKSKQGWGPEQTSNVTIGADWDVKGE